jgi:hypothetical protein
VVQPATSGRDSGVIVYFTGTSSPASAAEFGLAVGHFFAPANSDDAIWLGAPMAMLAITNLTHDPPRLMNSAASPSGFLQELETRQDDLLRQLDELDRRISAVLVEYSPSTAADDDACAAGSRHISRSHE